MRISDNPADETSLDYVQRVNRVVDHIVSNLVNPLSLETVAQVACFSPYHFHRVFKLLMGETVNAFVRRLRLERALVMRTQDPDRSFTEIAFACGFTSSSDFSRCFKQRYGVPPSVFDPETLRAQRRGELEALISSDGQSRHLQQLPAGANPDGFEVDLRRLPPRTVAYIRVLNSYQPGAAENALQRLFEWAEPRGLADGQWLGYMWDDPGVVALEDCRYDVGLEVPSVEPAGEVGRFEFPAMLVAQVEIRGNIELVQRALDWLFGTWLPRSRYLPDNQPCFEAWIGRPYAHGDEHFEVHAQLPVVPA